MKLNKYMMLPQIILLLVLLGSGIWPMLSAQDNNGWGVLGSISLGFFTLHAAMRVVIAGNLISKQEADEKLAQKREGKCREAYNELANDYDKLVDDHNKLMDEIEKEYDELVYHYNQLVKNYNELVEKNEHKEEQEHFNRQWKSRKPLSSESPENLFEDFT